MIGYRPADRGDTSFLAQMLLEAVNWHPERHLPMTRLMADPELAHYIAGWPRAGDGGVVAVANGLPIGAVWWRFFALDDPGYGFVSADVPELSMGVAPTWRGRGVGRALLGAAIAAAASHCHRISLSVERANRAQNLYLSMGFRVVSSGRDSDTMVHDLVPETSEKQHGDQRAEDRLGPAAPSA
jgi:GNAT superfamily N-acetyltransferase